MSFITTFYCANAIHNYQLLEGVGIISSLDSKKAIYQESVTAPLSHGCDDEDPPQDGDMGELESPAENLHGTLSSVQKVSGFICCMLNDRSAPQNCHGCMLESSVLPSLVT
jgi:hypothetical protein